MQLLAYAQLRKKEFISSGEIASALNIHAEQEWKLLNRMAASGMIIRLKRGVCPVPSHLPAGGRWTLSGYTIPEGTCCQAANWLRLGSTQGRTRNDRNHCIRAALKDVYLFPLTPDFRRELCAWSSTNRH